MPKNPNSPPWETNREITLVNAQDLDYVEAKADEYSTLLIELARKGMMTVTESVAKVHYPMDGDMIIKKIFLVLVREGILTGPDGRLRNYTIDAVWVSKKIKEAVEEEKNRKEEEEDEEGEDEEGEEEKERATNRGETKPKKAKAAATGSRKRALQDASNILFGDVNAATSSSGGGGDGGGAGIDTHEEGVSVISKKNRRRIDMDRSDPLAELGLGLLQQEQVKAGAVADLAGILNAQSSHGGMDEKLVQEVNEQLTITLHGGEDGVPVSVAQAQCADAQISQADFLKVLQWKHDQNHLYVDGDITDPSSTIYPM
jgi:hypothetical protein